MPAQRAKMKWLRVTTLVIVCFASQGCVYLPLPAKVVWGRRIQQTEVTFVKVGATTRSQIAERLGAPDKVYTNPPVSVYWWLERTGYWVYGVPSEVGWMGDGGELNRTGLLLILFGADGCVKKTEIRYAPRTGVT